MEKDVPNIYTYSVSIKSYKDFDQISVNGIHPMSGWHKEAKKRTQMTLLLSTQKMTLLLPVSYNFVAKENLYNMNEITSPLEIYWVIYNYLQFSVTNSYKLLLISFIS